MQMPKPSDADKERFRSALPDRPDVIVKPMFGNLGAFVNGNMFAGLFGPPTIGVRLSDADKAELEANHLTQPFGLKNVPWADTQVFPQLGTMTLRRPSPGWPKPLTMWPRSRRKRQSRVRPRSNHCPLGKH